MCVGYSGGRTVVRLCLSQASATLAWPILLCLGCKRQIAPTWSEASEHAIIPLENTDSWGDLLMPDTLPRDGGYPVRVALAPGRIVIGLEQKKAHSAVSARTVP